MARTSVLADDLSRHLRERILSGEFHAGDSVSETGVAAEYGVARPTARSALDRLVVDSLLVRHAHASLRVREVTPNDLREVVEILEFLEVRAVERVVAANADLRGLRDAVRNSLHKFLDVLVGVSGSELSARFHRQATFEYLLGVSEADRTTSSEDAQREVMSAFVDALWKASPEEARRQLEVLWSDRRERMTLVLNATLTTGRRP